MTFHFFALAALGEGLSGGDRIFIEIARRWAAWGHQIHIYVWQEGYDLIATQKLKHQNIHYHVVNLYFFPKLGFVINYFARIIAGIYLGFTLHPSSPAYHYSASDFWMDSLPALILKWRFPKIIWFAGWYQTAPSPFSAFSGYPLFYWLSQRLIKPFIARLADHVLVNNALETRRFPTKSHVVLGAVDTAAVRNYINNHPHPKKLYAAVFAGRFHPQKGVLELLDIWALVLKTLPSVKLVMVGDGELMSTVKAKIQKLGLDQCVDLTGYLFDGSGKYKVFCASHVVVHPALYDSGGMFAAEAMAFELPAVGFDLPAYQSYYPSGMLKVPIGNQAAFASVVIDLLTHPKKRDQLGRQAQKLVFAKLSWDSRAREILSYVTT